MVGAGYPIEMICKVLFGSGINADPQHCLYNVIRVDFYATFAPNIPYGGEHIFVTFSNPIPELGPPVSSYRKCVSFFQKRY